MSDLFEKARQSVQEALNSQRTSFYRDLYRGVNYRDPDFPRQEEWRSIPILKREYIAQVPLKARTFIPMSEVDSIGTTSGTSGNGLLLIPRDRDMVRPYTLEQFYGAGKALMWFNPFCYIFRDNLGPQQQLIIGDRAHMAESAALCAAWGVDSLRGASSILIAFAPYLQETMDLQNIRSVRVSTERCSALQLQTLHKLYPRALIADTYTSVEASHAAYSPQNPLPAHPLALVSTDEFFAECLDAEGLPVPVGSEGELVLTSFERKAFPLIRYATGDRILVLERPEDGRLVFEVRGRSIETGARIDGGELLLAELERAIAALSPDILDFEAVVGEVSGPRGPQVTLSITLFMLEPPVDASGLGQKLAGIVRVNEQRTYQDGVAQGKYQPIECTVAQYRIEQGRKRRHLRDSRI